MARKNVLVMPMYKYYRKAPKSEFLGWGFVATRKVTSVAASPKLLAYRSCVAGKLSGKKFANLKAIQEEFKKVADECSKAVATKRTERKKAKVFSL